MGLTEPVRAAVVGCGGAGRNHAAEYRRAFGTELVGVCDVGAERAADLADESGVPAFGDTSLDGVAPRAWRNSRRRRGTAT